jgi:glutamine amidotransferase
MKVGIVQYNAGNVSSLLAALRRLGAEAELCSSAEKLAQYERVIFPGVGEMSSAMAYLRQQQLDTALRALQQPVLGICLGLQIFCSHSEEGNAQGLGIFASKVRRFQVPRKVPHVGWNSLHELKGPLFRGLDAGADVYFVHSYRAEPGSDCSAICHYEEPFAAALQRANFFALQFHPEKSGPVGQQILRNFMELSL